MELKAWFSEYQAAHQPCETWSQEVDQAVRTTISLWEKTGDEAAKVYVIRWADCLAAGKGTAACWRPLFFALQETGEERYRTAIGAVIAELGRDLSDTVEYRELPFRMAYEMKLGGMEKVGLVAAAFRRLHAAGWDVETGLFMEDPQETALYLTVLMDAIETCSDQLYEHWRALVDLYREALKGTLAAGNNSLTVMEALLRGVKRGIIDPERYLPIAKARLTALQADSDIAAAMLALEGGAF